MRKILVLPAVLLFAGLCFIIFPSFISSGDIDLKIQPVSVIMPAAYKVYGNPDVAGGRYNLFKAVIKNSSSSEIRNLKVQYRVPKLVDEWTDVPSSSNLLPGQTAVVTCYPVFPQNITQRNTSSKEKAEIRVTYGGKANPTEKDESFPFDMVSVNDLVFSGMADQDKAYVGDFLDNCVLYACMVSAGDPIIKHYAETIQQRILCGETGANVGSGGAITDKDVQEKIRVLEGVYNATLLSHMVYSETGAGVTKFNDNTSSTEHIRLPREVVSGNTGLCIELALLHASVYKAAGLSPVIFLVPSHAYPGIKIGNEYIAIESTGIGGEGLGGRMTADQAFNRGMEELKEFGEQSRKGNPMYRMLDIDQLYSEGFKDMELTPDPILSAQVDKILANWPTCLVNPSPAADEASNTPPAPSPEPAPKARTRRSSWASYNTGSLSFEYPANWTAYNRPLAQLPQMVSVFVSPEKMGQVEVFKLPNAKSPQQAIGYIRNVISRLGENITYQQTDVYGDITRFDGHTVTNGQTMNWAGFFRNVNGGVEGIVVGTSGGSTDVVDKIIHSIH